MYGGVKREKAGWFWVGIYRREAALSNLLPSILFPVFSFSVLINNNTSSQFISISLLSNWYQSITRS